MLTHLFFQSPTFVLMSISFIRSENTLCNVHFHYGLIRMLIERERRISLNFIKDRVWKFHIDVAHLTQSHAFHLSIVKRQVLLFWACIVTFCKLWNFTTYSKSFEWFSFKLSSEERNIQVLWNAQHIFCSSDAKKLVLLRELIVKPKLHFISSATRSKKMSQMSTKNQQINFRTDKVTVHFAALATLNSKD